MTYELEIRIVDANGDARPLGGTISIVASDRDTILVRAREQIAKKNLPPLRTLNFTADGKLVAYCGDKPQRPTKTNERVVWKRPPGGEKRL